MARLRLTVFAVVIAALSVSPSAQWINYPTAAVPRTPDGRPNLTAPTPRTADGKPDLSGMWEMEHNLNVTPSGIGCRPPSREFLNIGASLKEGLPYQPWAADLVKTRRADPRLSPLTHGLPIGVVGLHTFPTFRKAAQSPGLLILLNEYLASYRQIFTDGRPLPVDPNPSWNGYSAGRWEGDTLVVEMIGFRDGLWLDNAGNPLTEAGRLTERFRRVNYGTLEIELTVNDPKAYIKPWTVLLRQIITLDTELLDFYNENEKDIEHLRPTTP